MEQHVITPKNTRRSAQQIKKLLSEFRDSNLNVKEFSALHNVSRAAFHNWQSKYGVEKARRIKKSGFAELEIAPICKSTGPALFAELRGIKLYQPVDAAYLKKLLS